MRRGTFQRGPGSAALAVAALLCLVSGAVAGADAVPGQPALHPGTPMILDPISGGFEFDLAGSETPKLQLQLAHPLKLEAGTQYYSSTGGNNVLGLDAALRLPIGNGLSLNGVADRVLANTQFQPVGSIQCLNGTLSQDSYTASGCRFVSEPVNSFDRRTLSLGASQEFGNVSASVNWFTSESETGSYGVRRLNTFGPSPLLESQVLAPYASTSFLTGPLSNQYLSGQADGIDLNFQVGITTDQAGDIRLGLALTRVLDASYQGAYDHNLGPLDWNLAESFDSAALGIEWSRGSFSGGIRGYYREPVRFLNRENLDSMSTFDVHFTWRTPWNANLSLGTTNVLGAGVDDRSVSDKSADRFESIYGRIPYVRYQQDL